jgi:hypothetical protein
MISRQPFSPVFIGSLLVGLISCGKTYVQLDENTLKQNESQILQEVYWEFSETDEYIRGHRMRPPMIFDEVYAMCLNLHPESIDTDFLNNSDSEVDISFDDWDVDMDDIQSMVAKKTPIVELTMHWVDPNSQYGSNGYVTYTYFLPNTKIENGELEIGRMYRVKSNLGAFKYFPYFHDNVLNTPLGGGSYLDIRNNSVQENFRVFHNGSFEKMSDFSRKQN